MQRGIVFTLTHLLRESMGWFLYDIGLRHERVKRMIFGKISSN